MFAYAAHAPTPPPHPPNVTGSSKLSVTLPQAVAASVPPGFAPSKNSEKILPTISNATSRGSIGFSLNDGYCFFGSGRCGQLAYHGGVVMHNASILIVLWAGCGAKGCLSCSTGYFDSSTIDPKASHPNDCTYGSLQVDYFKDFCAAGNPLLRVIDQYADGSGGLHSCSVYNGSAYYAYNRFPETPLSDADIQTEAIGVLNGLNISASTNTAVFVFTPYGISSCVGANDCFPTGSFCAYHSWFWSGSPFLSAQVIYASMPDDGWAGANCGLGGPSPNHDPWADLEVSPLSHEADESFTDPTPGYLNGDGWYYDGYLEIGDECAYDFVGTQPSDGSNVRLGLPGTNGDPYRIQSEWSNANGGCTLDLKGPPTAFDETIYPDLSTGTPASPQDFPISYQEAGETGAYSSIYSNSSGVTTRFYATLGSYVTTDPVIGSGERWCFDASCGVQSAYVAGQTFLEFYYFDLVHQSTSYQIKGGGSAPAPELSYQTAPASLAQGDNTVAGTLVLSNTTQEFWPLRGSTMAVPTGLAGGVTERWVTQQFLWKATKANTVPPAIVYYHQYSLVLSYSVVDGGAPENPILVFYQLGSAQETFLGNNPVPYWLDSGTSYQATNPLFGSTSTERWIARSWSGTANGSATVAFVYYHQYHLNASYSVIDGGTPAAPALQVEIFGVASSYQMTGAPTSVWIDANSWSAPVTLGPSATERWAAVGATNGTVDSHSPISIEYYHQFRFILGYIVSDNSAAAPPTLTSQSFGKTLVSVLSESTSSYWLDSGEGWRLNNVLNGSSALERWITNSPTSGVVSAPLPASFEYFHEFYVTIQTGQKPGGTVPTTSWYNATSVLVLTAKANNGWQFERWDGSGQGSYSGTTNYPTVTVSSAIVENATFYPGLVLNSGGSGMTSYKWGPNHGSLTSAATVYVPVGTNITLTANPTSSFFVFDGYTGAVSSAKAVASILVNGPATVSASFSLNYVLLAALFGGIGLGGVSLIYYLRRARSGAGAIA